MPPLLCEITNWLTVLLFCDVHIVEPLYNGQVGASAFCPLYAGVLYRKVLSISAFQTSNIIFIISNHSCRLYKIQSGKVGTNCVHNDAGAVAV